MARLLLVLSLLCGCVSEEPDPIPPPALDLPRMGLALEPWVEVLYEAPVELAVTLPGFEVVVAAESGLQRMTPLLEGPEDIEASLESVTGIAQLDDGLLLVSDASGLHTLGPDGQGASPLSELLVAEDVRGLLTTPGPEMADLWIVGSTDLHRWRDGYLYAVRPGAESMPDARLAWGPALDGSPALWAATDDSLLALLDVGGGLEARVEDGELVPTGLAVDGYGTVWAPTDGDLWSRTIDGQRQTVTLPVVVHDVASGAGSTDLWLATDEGLWHYAPETFRPVSGVTVERMLGVDGAGRVLVDTGDQLLRVASSRTVLFVGLADGDTLDEAIDVCVVASWAEGLEGLTVLSDGEAVEPTSTDPLCFGLDPELLADGSHDLVATAQYTDTEVEASLFFSVGEFVPPTWTDDIEPLFQAECGLCHRAEQGSVTVGGGRPLDTLVAWQADIDLILEVLEDGRMPLNNPSLSGDDIRTIEDWRAGGFLE